jgi:hypothetical protein
MERDAILAHGVTGFVRETYMKRADGYETYVCNGCGTIPVYNDKENLFLCPMCDGPVRFIGETAATLEPLPPVKRSLTSFSKVEMPYAMKLLDNELATYMNIGMRVLTDQDVTKFRGPPIQELTADQTRELLAAPLPQRVLPETEVPEMIEQKDEATVRLEDLAALGAIGKDDEALEAAAAAEEEAVNASGFPGSLQLDTGSAVPAAPVPTVNGQPAGVNLPLLVAQPQQGNLLNVPAALPPPDGGIQEVGFDAIPEVASGPPMALGPGAGSVNAGSVNVQTTSQPVLVVPVNFGQQQSGAEFLNAAVPGAPRTLAVDTSAQAMNAVGLPALPPPPQRGGSKPRSRSQSPGSRGVGGGTVTVNKMGSGGGEPMSSSPNVRVTVMKQG